MSTTKYGRSIALGLLGTALIFSGDCVPKRFWINTWEATLSAAAVTVTDTAIDLYVVDPLVEAIQDTNADG